jgi:hypothetical protein
MRLYTFWYDKCVTLMRLDFQLLTIFTDDFLGFNDHTEQYTMQLHGGEILSYVEFAEIYIP